MIFPFITVSQSNHGDISGESFICRKDTNSSVKSCSNDVLEHHLIGGLICVWMFILRETGAWPLMVMGFILLLWMF